jgi:hypothetical protein
LPFDAAAPACYRLLLSAPACVVTVAVKRSFGASLRLLRQGRGRCRL